MARSDPELLDRLSDERTANSLRTLYRRYSRELFAFAYQALGDRGAAYEVVPDVSRRCGATPQRHDRRRGSFRTRMYRIARNAVIDRRRHPSVRPALAAFAADPANEPGVLDESIAQAALRRQLAAAPTRLTPEHREVVRTAHYEGMTMREIAEATGLPVGTIKDRAWYALHSLRLALEETEAVAA